MELGFILQLWYIPHMGMILLMAEGSCAKEDTMGTAAVKLERETVQLSPATVENIVKPSITTGLKRAALNKLIDYLISDPEVNMKKVMDLADKTLPKNLFSSQRTAFRRAIDEENNWYRLLMKMMKLNPEVMPQLLKSFLVEGNLLAWPVQEANRKKLQCNIPWAILLDPTSACNLHCTGCWAAEYGHNVQLTYDEIDSIIRQGKALGTHIYIYTGGEPLVRKRDLIKLCEAHPDCAFLSFTNATLIDEEFCKEMVRVKNFIPAISVEGIGDATDVRRGEGTFAKIDEAMGLLRDYRLPFGVSCCHTSQNADAIASEEFFDWLIDQGALFAWIFTFMPVGYNSTNELMVTPQQREHLYHFVREMRLKKPLFTLDFQNDGEFVGGCIAGGRRYLHINANGDVEPCVFAHYSDSNIREVSLLEAFQRPLFKQYYEGQPFDGNNLLRPCPIYENTGRLAQMVEESGAKSTDLEHAEDPRELGEKFAQRAREWDPVAERLWYDGGDERAQWRARRYVAQSEADIEKYERLGRVGSVPLEERDRDVQRIKAAMGD